MQLHKSEEFVVDEEVMDSRDVTFEGKDISPGNNTVEALLVGLSKRSTRQTQAAKLLTIIIETIE